MENKILIVYKNNPFRKRLDPKDAGEKSNLLITGLNKFIRYQLNK